MFLKNSFFGNKNSILGSVVTLSIEYVTDYQWLTHLIIEASKHKMLGKKILEENLRNAIVILTQIQLIELSVTQ